MRFLLFAIVPSILISLVITNTSWSSEKAIFPYGQPSLDVQLKLKYYDPTAMRTAVYSIKAGDVEGEADFVSAPTPDLGQLILHSKITVLQSTAGNMRAPYGGEITTTIECTSRKYVKEQAFSFRGLSSKLILAVASGRKNFGVCSLEEVGYAALYFAAYDEQKKHVLTVQLFKPITDPNKIEISQQEILKILQKVIN